MRAASVNIFSRSLSRNANVPNEASAACCRSSFSTVRDALLLDHRNFQQARGLPVVACAMSDHSATPRADVAHTTWQVDL